jgi:hypothetical protein
MNHLSWATPIIRRKFSPEEDRKLEMLVAEHGAQNWIKVASLMKNRDVRQCRERWTHFLAPEIAKGEWTKEEDSLLEAKVLEHGNKWKMFESFFPGRIDTSIKNRYHLMLRHKRKEMRVRRSPTKRAKRAVLPEQESAPSEGSRDGEFPNWDSEWFDDMWAFLP